MQVEHRYYCRRNHEKYSQQSQNVRRHDYSPSNDDVLCENLRGLLRPFGRRVRPRHRNAVHLFSLSQSMSERLNSATAFAGPEAKHDLREINHITISKSAGDLASGKLQFDDAINLF